MKTIGVLGGGQLAQMLLSEGRKLGLEVRAYCQSDKEPAFPLNSNNTLGSISDTAKLKAFLNDVDICTFESEFIDCTALKSLGMPDSKFCPSLKLMAQLQDRKSQKDLLAQYKVPQLPYFFSEKVDWLYRAANELGFKVVFKRRRNSYDGYGTFVCRNKSQVQACLDQHEGQLESLIMEPLFDFKRELAISVYQSKTQDRGSFPLVEWKAKDAKCYWVKGPTKSKHLTPMEKRLLNFIRCLDYYGVMAFEFFENSKGLFVNELAPRVHNSAHYSLSSMGLSQFAVHLQCLTGEKLPRRIQTLSPGFAMVNLIGTGRKKTELSAHPESQLFWYGKSENRMGRKLGHINSIGPSPEAALKRALRGEKKCQV